MDLFQKNRAFLINGNTIINMPTIPVHASNS